MCKKIVKWLIDHSKTATSVVTDYRNEIIIIYENILLKQYKKEKEYCEWEWEKLNDDNCEAMVECRHDKVYFESFRFFKFCPYCGKKLQIK